MSLRTLGLCVGASSIDAASVERNGKNITLLAASSNSHEGNPKRALMDYLLTANIEEFDGVVLTGRKFKEIVELTTITEPEAVETAARFTGKQKEIEAIVSAGGETFLLYVLNRRGEISSIHSGNKCASGTGEFFLQQIKRMSLTVNQAIDFAESSEPYQVSGRCSVFCKSDCTHALNRGAPIGEICAGLCEMMSEKILELLASRDIGRIMLIGGTSLNRVMVRNLKTKLEKVIVPAEASYFEALGAALWALDNRATKLEDLGRLYSHRSSSFAFLSPLPGHRRMVDFREMAAGRAEEGDICILGLDVGSTTTKAIVLRTADNAILGSEYLRTGGDPVTASRKCYAALNQQIGARIRIVGLGVTGSGRQIAGLHALTLGIINEIIAHATASIYFGRDVDTIFEIGGQDAKYTYITAGVPSDYAMNEACSAGTGSFLEEAARESFEIDYRQIEGFAMKAEKPPNFNDQCAAFINSDIKTALQEGISREDIMAGLVYSICANYLNKVKGARPFGKKIFMQGGVCYNRAVPIAMSALLQRRIIVPPEPGLMGAFGVALEIKSRLALGLMEEQEFELKQLAQREVTYLRSFTCRGGRERCDRKCGIRVIRIDGERHPFGGACDRYYNLRTKKSFDTERLNLVKFRQNLVFGKPGSVEKEHARSIGINKSFLMNSYYPLFFHFFTELGMRVILPQRVRDEGVKKKGSSFCYPYDVSHGLFADLLMQKPDYLFLPQILEIEGETPASYRNCVFVQSEAYILQEAFRPSTRCLTPLLWFKNGIEEEKPKFISMAGQLGYRKSRTKAAFEYALRKQQEFEGECRRIGEEVLKKLDSDEIGIVLFGRSYNAFADETNMSVPHKFASRGVRIIPYDLLPCEDNNIERSMYWGQGRRILACADFVRSHPNLYGAYITNFSCGPDSFVITYFRQIMGQKPSLTLELDNHTADTGLNTRIDAFLDIIKRYRELEKREKIHKEQRTGYRAARIEIENEEVKIISSNGRRHELTDKEISVLIPSMGELNIQSLSAVLRRVGIRAMPLPIPDFESLKIGRKNSSCKECLPLQLTTGSLLNYIEAEKNKDEVTVFFMPSSDGPCRFGQYHVYMSRLIEELGIEDVAVLSLNSVNGYSEISVLFDVIDIFWQGFVFADLMGEAKSVLRVLAEDKDLALKIHFHQWERFLDWTENGRKEEIADLVRNIAYELSKIPLKRPISSAKYIALVGEIYVRHDHFCQREIIQKLESQGFVVRVAPVTEWLAYMMYIFKLKPLGLQYPLKKRIKFNITIALMMRLERKIKRLFVESGLYDLEMLDIPKTIDHAKHVMSEHVYGEAILTVGLTLREILHNACGVISIGPFGCMPSRLAEAILTSRMSIEGISDIKKVDDRFKKNTEDLPFLAIETDGNPFPQLIDTRLEAFCLQAEKIGNMMVQERAKGR
jgi:predicted CoA-substrate-specific enzyme activase